MLDLSYGYSEMELGTYKQELHREPGPGLQVGMVWQGDAKNHQYRIEGCICLFSCDTWQYNQIFEEIQTQNVD